MSQETRQQPYSYPPQEGVKKKVTPQKDFEKFPHGIHSKDGRIHRQVHSQEEMDQKLSEGWLEHEPEIQAAEPVVSCPNCARLKEKFEVAFKTLAEETDDLQKSYDELLAQTELPSKKKNGRAAKQSEPAAA